MQGRARSYFSSLCHLLPPAAPTRGLTDAPQGAVPELLGAREPIAPCPAQGNPFGCSSGCRGKPKGVGTTQIPLGMTGWSTAKSPGRLCHVLLLLLSASSRLGGLRQAGFVPPRWESAASLLVSMRIVASLPLGGVEGSLMVEDQPQSGAKMLSAWGAAWGRGRGCDRRSSIPWHSLGFPFLLPLRSAGKPWGSSGVGRV